MPPPKQTTLGKFFTLPSGAKPPPKLQQTELRGFASAASKGKGKGKGKAAEEDEDEGIQQNRDSESEVEIEAPPKRGRGATVGSSSKSAKTKKAKLQDDEVTSDAAEPVTGKEKSAVKNTQKKTAKSPSKATKEKEIEEEVEDQVDGVTSDAETPVIEKKKRGRKKKGAEAAASPKTITKRSSKEKEIGDRDEVTPEPTVIEKKRGTKTKASSKTATKDSPKAAKEKECKDEDGVMEGTSDAETPVIEKNKRGRKKKGGEAAVSPKTITKRSSKEKEVRDRDEVTPEPTVIEKKKDAKAKASPKTATKDSPKAAKEWEDQDEVMEGTSDAEIPVIEKNKRGRKKKGAEAAASPKMTEKGSPKTVNEETVEDHDDEAMTVTPDAEEPVVEKKKSRGNKKEIETTTPKKTTMKVAPKAVKEKEVEDQDEVMTGTLDAGTSVIEKEKEAKIVASPRVVKEEEASDQDDEIMTGTPDAQKPATKKMTKKEAGIKGLKKEKETIPRKRVREATASPGRGEIDEEVSEVSDDEEPVTKRNRRSAASKPEISEDKNPVRRRSKSPVASKPDTSEDEKPKKKRGRPAKSPVRLPKSSEKESKPESVNPFTTAAAAALKKKQKNEAAIKKKATKKDTGKEESGKESGSESAMEDNLEASDEEKPALPKKALEKVQKELSKPTHPHPDWKPGSPIPYAALAKTFTLIESTTKRLEKLAHTALFLRQVLRLTPDELLLVIHLMTNKLAADYEGVELGIGESLIMKAISESCGRSMEKIKEDQRGAGDLGAVAMVSRNTQRVLFQPKPLSIESVHRTLLEIATTKGDGGHGRKVSAIKKLLAAAKGEEAKYLVRGLEGKLRLGLAEKTVIVSLSHAVVVYEAEKEGKKASTTMLTEGDKMLRSIYSELPSYEVIIPAIMKHGIMNLKEICKLQPGVPLKPMLAKPTKAISEVLDRFENKRFTCEYKYDGERAQIHFVSPSSSVEYTTTSSGKGLTMIFSRSSEDLSKKYPDILSAMDKWVKPGVESFVLDCEAVAWDREEKRVLPFQHLMNRKRKNVVIEDVKIKVCVFAFDLLFLNGDSLVRKSLEERRALMHESFSEVEGEFLFATFRDGQDLEQIQTFLEESVKASCEGLMVKMLDGDGSSYEPSKRSLNWLKVKKDYLNGVGDSLDLVVLGAYHGRGKRTAVYGSFLLACYNNSTQTYESMCNIGTGFSEVNLADFHEILSELEIEKPKPYYSHPTGNMDQPDVWFEPKVVWEVKTADLTLSPRYKAAAGLADDSGSGKGVSLRFPRFIRIRDDKTADQATTSKQVAEMYKRQEVVVSGSKKGGVDEDFEY